MLWSWRRCYQAF